MREKLRWGERFDRDAADQDLAIVESAGSNSRRASTC